MHRGYVKLWRKSIDSGLLQNAEAWQFMSWCLLKATHKPQKQLVGKQVVKLEAGQFVFGRKSAAKDLCSTEQKIRTSLNLLKSLDFLTIKPTNKFSIITVVNWGTYQQEQPTNNQQPNQQATNNQPTSNQQATTNKNDKNIKNEKNKEYSPELEKFVDSFQKTMVDTYGGLAPKITTSSRNTSLDTVNKLIRIDGHSLEEIRAAMLWAVKDDFWSKNARSLGQLRNKSKSNGMTKFQNIWSAMKSEQDKKPTVGKTPTFYKENNDELPAYARGPIG